MNTGTIRQKAIAATPSPALLESRSRTGFGWNVAGGAARAALGLTVNTLLARQLGPEPFGQLALATVAVSFGTLVAESGLGVCLIQKPVIAELDIRFAFTAQMILGFAFGFVWALAAPLVAAGMRQPETAPVLLAMALALPIQAFGLTAGALLRRRLDFGRAQMLNVASYLLGYLGLGIPMALQGYGVWSLVFAQLVQMAAQSAGAWLLVGHSLRPHWARDSGAMRRMGLTITTSNLAAWAVVALPALLIGRFQGATVLGLYSRAFFVVSTPASILSASMQTSVLPLFSRLQKHPRVARRTCLGIMTVCLFATVPLFCAAAGMARTVIEALFGNSWAAAAGMLVPLALAMPLECLAALSGPLLIAAGRPSWELRVQLVTAVCTLAGVGYAAASLDAAGTAWAVLVAVYAVRSVAATAATLRITGVSLANWAARFTGIAVLGVCVFLVVASAEDGLTGQGVNAWVRLLLLGALAAGAMVLTALIDPRLVPWRALASRRAGL